MKATTAPPTSVTGENINPATITNAAEILAEAAAAFRELDDKVIDADLTPEDAAERWNEIAAKVADALSLN